MSYTCYKKIKKMKIDPQNCPTPTTRLQSKYAKFCAYIPNSFLNFHGVWMYSFY